jgi:hypothetical protein
MAIADDFTVDLVNKLIVTTQTYGTGEASGIPSIIYSMNEFYVFLQDYFDEPDRMDDLIPISAQTPTEYTLLNDWFIDDETIKSLFGGSLITSGWAYSASAGITALRWANSPSIAPVSGDIGKLLTGQGGGATGLLLAVDVTRQIAWVRNNNGSQFQDGESILGPASDPDFVTEATDGFASGDSGWANIFSLGTIEAETELYVMQENDFFYVTAPVQTKISAWWNVDVDFTDPRGFGGAGPSQIDLLVKVAEVGSLIDSGNLSVYARQYSKLYDFFSITASSTGAGRTPIPLSTGADLNNITAYIEVAYDNHSGSDIIVGDVLVDAAGEQTNRAGVLSVPAGGFPSAGSIGYYLIGKNQTALADNDSLDQDGDTGNIDVDFDSGGAMAGAVSELTGAFTGQLTESNNAGADDMSLMPADTITSGFNFGFATPFDEIVLNLGVSGTGGFVVVWEYSTGADGWTAVTVTDGTSSLTAAPGIYQITIDEDDLPTDWAVDTIDGQGPLYWLRVRYVSDTVTINPLGTQSWITGAKGPKLFPDITTLFGQALRDIDGDGNNEEYSCILDVNNNSLAEAYERAKYTTRRGETRELDSFGGGGQTGLVGEFYTAIGDILVNWDTEGGAAIVDGEPVQIEGAVENTAVVTSQHDQGSDGFLILRKVKGSFTNSAIIESVGTPANQVVQVGAAETVVPVKASPLGTFAGGTFFGARGVVLDNVTNAESNNYQVVTSDGDTVSPPATVTVLVSNLLAEDRVAVFRLTGVGGTIKKDQYSSHTSNNTLGGTTFEVDDGPITAESPAGGADDLAGTIRVVDDADSIEQRYRYESFTASTFTLNGAAVNVGTATETDTTGVTLTDASGGFQSTDDVQIGDEIRNSDDETFTRVKSITSDTVIVCDPPLAPGNGWLSGDNYTINHLTRLYTTSDTCYVSFLDKVVPTGDDEASALIVYTVDIPVIARVRRSIATKILPFAQETTISSSGMSVAAIRNDDTIAS